MREGRGACLAAGLELGPGVGPADLQGRFVVEDVVTQGVQRGLGVRRGELSRLLDLLPDLSVYFLGGREKRSGARSNIAAP